MYLPPNGASNAAFLETLRLMLVHENRPTVPRAVRALSSPTRPRAGGCGRERRSPWAPRRPSFGPVSFSIAAAAGAVRASVEVPKRAAPKALSLRLRLPDGYRIARVTLGGRPWQRFDAATGTIDLTGRTGRLELRAEAAATRWRGSSAYSRTVGVTPETRRWDELFAARTRGVGDGIAAILAFAACAGSDLVRGRLPRPADLPARARVRAPAGVRRRRRGERVPVRADARARRAARRARGPARVAAGPPACRGRAADHERRDGGARARRQVVPRPRRRGRRRGPDLPRRDHGLPQLRGRRRRRAAGRARARRRRARAAARGRAAPEAPLHDPRPPEPGRRQPLRRAARPAGRARAPLRVPRRRGRRLPRARVRRRPRGEPLEPRAGVGRPGGDDVEDVLPGRASRLGGRPGGGLGPARLGEAEHRPVRGRARAAALRGVRAPRLDRGAARAVAGPVPAQVRADARGARALHARGHAVDAPRGRLLLLADAARGRRRGRPRTARRRARRRRRARARRSIRTAAAATTCGCRSAWSTSRRSTRASSGSPRSSAEGLPRAAGLWSDQVPRPGGHTCR